MRRTGMLAAVVGLLMLTAILASAVVAEDEMCVPMGEIELEALAPEPQRSEVAFPHAVHFSYSCQRCHHNWDNQAPIASCTTSGCHDLAELPKNDEGQPVRDETQQMRYYKNAFHDLCIGCHKEIKARNKAMEASRMAVGEPLPAAGPTGCSECHPKY